MKNIRTLSLFSGGGGLDLGFQNAGFEILCSIEFDKPCCKTLEANKGIYFSNYHRVICNDIREIEPEELNLGNIDFIIGGPPCQSFSAAGRRAGGVCGVKDTRGTLFGVFCSFIESLKPSGFLFENVRGLLQSNRRSDWEIIKNAFEQLGYHLSYRILDAADYGVPQHRERLFLIGTKEKLTYLFPRPTHGPDSPTGKDHVSALESMKDLQKENEEVPNYGGKYGDLVMEVPPGHNYLYFTEEMGHPNPRFAWRSKFSNFLYKADPNLPVKTLVANQGRYGGPFHWLGRKFTIPELKRIQGFPDNYVFFGGRTQVEKQIGNSVAPPIAEALAKSIRKQIFQDDAAVVNLMERDFELTFDKRKARKASKTRKKARENMRESTFQVLLFEQNKHEEANDRFSLKWFYQSPRERTKFSNTDNDVVEVKGKLEKGLWDLEIRKGSGNVEVRVILEFLKPVNSKFNRISCKALLESVWEYAIAWDSIDYAISRSTSYAGIEPLYGHFTEPYPKFSLHVSISRSDDESMSNFIKAISEFRYLSGLHHLDELLRIFGYRLEYSELIQKLRSHGFDVRSNETNPAIAEGYYRCCYPFTNNLSDLSFVKFEGARR